MASLSPVIVASELKRSKKRECGGRKALVSMGQVGASQPQRLCQSPRNSRIKLSSSGPPDIIFMHKIDAQSPGHMFLSVPFVLNVSGGGANIVLALLKKAILIICRLLSPVPL